MHKTILKKLPRRGNFGFSDPNNPKKFKKFEKI
jgi:hypothetical protein